MNLNQITLPAKDIQLSVAFYRELGFTQIVSADHYARFESIEGESTFSLHKVSDDVENISAVIYFETHNLEDVVNDLKAKGFVFEQEIQAQPWLWREARLRDPSNNQICIYYAGDNRRNPPWRLK